MKKKLLYSVAVVDGSEDVDGGRPNSARSRFTTAVSANQTNFTTNTGNASNTNTFKEQFDAATLKLMDKNAKLSDYLKYDSALSRDQQIEIGRISTLGDAEKISISMGVALTQFGPQKKLHNYNKDDTKDTTSEISGEGAKKHITFEEKMAKRARDVAEGRISAPEALFTKTGSNYYKHDQMSQKEYYKNHTNFGTIGKMKKIQENSEDDDLVYGGKKRDITV